MKVVKQRASEFRSVIETEIPGGWREQKITVGEQTFDLVLPAEPDEFLNDLESIHEGDDEKDPYWAALWPTAQRTAEFISTQPWKQGTRALELGCGVGLVGLAALAAGLEVTFTDLHELAVATAVENATRNGFEATRGRVLDWRQPDGDRFPLILGADLLYDAKLHRPLLDALDRLLARDGVCWIGDPGRSATETFLTAASARDCELAVLDETSHPIEPAIGRFQLVRVSPRGSRNGHG
jgi:predicted nicotinamide N-methyase